jgi:hypothetical protein
MVSHRIQVWLSIMLAFVMNTSPIRTAHYLSMQLLTVMEFGLVYYSLIAFLGNQISS